MRKALILILLYFSPSLAFPSAFGSLSFLSRLDQEEYDSWTKNCGVSDVESGKNIGWFVAVHNKVTQRYNGAAVITPKHVLATRVSIWNDDGSPTPLESLEVLIFKSTDMSGIESTTEKAYQKTFVEFGVHQEYCQQLHCEDRLKGTIMEESSRNAMGEPDNTWFRTVHGRDQLLGISIGNGMAVSIEFWSDFICKMIGACVHGFETQSPKMHSDFPYFLDGVFHAFHKEDECTTDHRLHLIRQSTPFTRLTKIEQRSLQRVCGKTFDDGNTSPKLELWSSFLVTIVTGSEHCYTANFGQINDCKEREYYKCSGALISPLHVITSSSCMKHLFNKVGHLKGHIIRAIFTDSNGYEGEQFPFQDEDILSSHYDPKKVGKRWIRVAKVIAPFVDRYGKRHQYDLALVQLEQRIPLESHIKPICISQEVVYRPPFSLVADFETVRSDGRVDRKIYVERFDESMNDANEDMKDEQYLLGFMTNKTLGIENHGSPLIDYVYEGDREISKFLIGIVIEQQPRTKDNGMYTQLSRIDYFSTFICIHTGVCKDGETFSRRLFAPTFIEKDLTFNTELIDRGLARGRHASGLSWHAHWLEMDSIVEALLREVPVKFTAEQNQEVQAECGKKPPENRMFHGKEFNTSQYPWPVYIGVELDGETHIECTGVLISRRHVITARHCFTDLDITMKHVVLYGGVRYLSDKDSFKQVSIRHKIYQFSTDDFVDVAIGELDHDIEGPMRFVCIPKKDDYNVGAFEKKAIFFGGGVGENERNAGEKLLYKIYDFADPNVVFETISSTEFFLSHKKKSSDYGYAGRGDSGGPLLFKRTSDDRYTLYGVFSGSNCESCEDGKERFTSMIVFANDVCRITGICAEDLDKTRQSELVIDGSRLCN